MSSDHSPSWSTDQLILRFVFSYSGLSLTLNYVTNRLAQCADQWLW